MGGGGEGRKEARKLPGGLRDFCHAPSAAVVAAKGRARSAGGGSAPRWRQPQFLLQLPHLRSPATPCGRRASAAAAVSDSPGRGGDGGGGARRASPVFYFILYFIFFWLMIMILYLSLPHRQHAVYLPSPPQHTHASWVGALPQSDFPAAPPRLRVGRSLRRGVRWSPPPRPAPSISPCSHGGSARGVGGSPLQPSLCPRGCPLAAGGTAGCPDPCRAHTALHPELSPSPGQPLPHSLPALPYGEGALPLPSPPLSLSPGLWEGAASARSGGNPLMASLLHPLVWGPSPRP